MNVSRMLFQNLKNLLLRNGIKVQRVNAYSDSGRQLSLSIISQNIDTVIDIGANIGQFAQDIRRNGYSKKIISYEPLMEAHQRLSALAKTDTNWIVAPRMAIGERDGELEINVSKNLVSSSILPMLASHSTIEEESVYVKKEEVPIARLENGIADFVLNSKRIFIKIDTQGYEWQVLSGIGSLWEKVAGITCEMSLVPLYDGQKSWLEIISFMETKGFEVWALQQGFTDMNRGRTLQIDGVFYRKNAFL
jgi:FkbM family methyltransferase